MICISATYVAKPGNEAEVIAIVGKMSEHTRQEPGNLMYLLHRSVAEPRKFFLYEQYEDQAAIEAHRAAPYFKEYVLEKLIPLLESRVPEIYEPLF